VDKQWKLKYLGSIVHMLSCVRLTIPQYNESSIVTNQQLNTPTHTHSTKLYVYCTLYLQTIILHGGTKMQEHEHDRQFCGIDKQHMVHEKENTVFTFWATM